MQSSVGLTCIGLVLRALRTETGFSKIAVGTLKVRGIATNDIIHRDVIS